MAKPVEVTAVLTGFDFDSIFAAAEKSEKVASAKKEKVITAGTLIVDTLNAASVGAWAGKLVAVSDPIPGHSRKFADRRTDYVYEVHDRAEGWRAVAPSLTPAGIILFCYTGMGRGLNNDAAETFANDRRNWRKDAPAPTADAPAQETPTAQE